MEEEKHPERGDDHHQGSGRDVDRLGQLEAEIELVHGGIDQIEGVPPETLEETHGILQEEGDADGGDEGYQAGRAAQGPVGHPLHRCRQQPADQHPGEQKQDQDQEGREIPQDAVGLQPQQDLDPDEGADHEDLAVGEVDELQHPINHRVAEGDQGVHEPQDEAVQNHLGKDADHERNIHRTSPWKKRGGAEVGPSRRSGTG